MELLLCVYYATFAALRLRRNENNVAISMLQSFLVATMEGESPENDFPHRLPSHVRFWPVSYAFIMRHFGSKW
jgi:hypothetical protein